jgi:tetrapyrrole methylase family protein/MazG family protein
MVQHNESTFDGLRKLLSRLRGPGGCPWDKEQTHKSLRSSLLEECYEALEAVDRSDAAGLAEELGDIMLQLAYHCQIAEEKGAFAYEDVCRRINEKLVRRHPHVFGDEEAKTAHQAEMNWEVIKEKERAGRSTLLGGLPTSMPALAMSQAISHRAARSGFEWDSVAGVLGKIAEELGELERSMTQQEREHEVGDVLFSLVNLARWHGVDAESALRVANARFRGRFNYMEASCLEHGVTFTTVSMEEKQALWEAAKERQHC